MNMNIARYNHDMLVREGTSDMQAVDEVFVKHNYRRRGFFVAAGEQWLDMGGHIGSFSVWAARQGARVVAFEPDPDHYEMLLKNTKGLFVEAHNFGLGVSDETLRFFRNSAKGKTWRNTFKKEWRGGEEITAQIRHYAPFIWDDVSIKMDIEGYELEILRDMLKTGAIKKVKKLVFEYTFDINTKVSDFMEIIHGLRQYFDVEGVTENFLTKLQQHEHYPQSWFPPCKVIYCKRK